MAKTDFSLAGWYADIFRWHEIASRIRVQRRNLPESMRMRHEGGLGEERYFADRGHPAGDVLRAYDFDLLNTVPSLSATIVAEKERRALRSTQGEPTLTQKYLLYYLSSYLGNDDKMVEDEMVEKLRTGYLEHIEIEVEHFWQSIISKLKQTYPYYFPSTNERDESEEGRACALLALLVSGLDLTLGATDVKILKAVARSKTPIGQADLETKLNVSRRTLGPKLKNLRLLGLLNRPKGKRSGDSITTKGLEVLSQFIIPKASH